MTKKKTMTNKELFAVFLLCVLRATFIHARTSEWAAHTWMSGRAYESSLSMSRPVYRLKTSAVLWQCGWSGTNTPPDEGGQNYPPPGVLALCQLHRKCLINTLKTVRTRPSRSTSAVVNTTTQLAKRLAKQPGSSPSFGSLYELQTIWTENDHKSN